MRCASTNCTLKVTQKHASVIAHGQASGGSLAGSAAARLAADIAFLANPLHLPSVSGALEQTTPFGPATATCRGLALRPLDRVYVRDSSVAFSHTSAVEGPSKVTSGKVVVMRALEPVLSFLQVGVPAVALTATAAGSTPSTA